MTNNYFDDQMNLTNYLDDRIEAKLIAKIAHYRLSVRTQFRNRHHAAWPELTYKTIIGDLNNLKVWLRIAERLDDGRPPYSTYIAKKLTNDTRRN